MAYAIHNLAGAQAIDVTSDVQKHPLGTIVTATDPTYGQGEFVYQKGVASTVVGDCVVFNQSAGSTTRTVAGSKGMVGFAMSANVANQWGWYQVSGVAVANVLASFASAADVYVTATAGSLDDAVVAGDLIAGCVSVSAIGTPTAGTALLQINRPSIA